MLQNTLYNEIREKSSIFLIIVTLFPNIYQYFISITKNTILCKYRNNLQQHTGIPLCVALKVYQRSGRVSNLFEARRKAPGIRSDAPG